MGVIVCIHQLCKFMPSSAGQGRCQQFFPVWAQPQPTAEFYVAIHIS